MDNRVFKIPEPILDKYPDWYERVAAQCPFLHAAIEYALENTINISYSKMLEGGAGGRADISRRELQVLHNDGVSIPEFHNYLSHEIKHFAQADACPDFHGWAHLAADVVKSIKTGEYQLKRIYRLLTIESMAVHTLAIEMDAYDYGAEAHQEAEKIFPDLLLKKAEIGELENTVDARSEIMDVFVNPYLDSMLTFVGAYLKNVQILANEFNAMPSVQWIAASTDKINKSTNTLWGEINPEYMHGVSTLLEALPQIFEVSKPEIAELQKKAQSILPKASAKIFHPNFALV